MTHKTRQPRARNGFPAVLILSILSAPFGTASPNPPEIAAGRDETLSTTVLRTMEKEWEEIHTFHARISQVHRDPDGDTIAHYEGEMWLLRPHHLRINYREIRFATSEEISLATRYTHVIFTRNPEYLYEYDIEENTITQDHISGISSIPFVKAVAGIEAFKEEEFRDKYYIKEPVLEEEWNGTEVQLLRARAKRAYEEEYYPFDVWIGKEDAVPRLIDLDYSQEKVKVRIHSFEINPAMSESIFDVKLPADVIPIVQNR